MKYPRNNLVDRIQEAGVDVEVVELARSDSKQPITFKTPAPVLMISMRQYAELVCSAMGADTYSDTFSGGSKNGK